MDARGSKIFVAGYYGFGNAGDEAVLAGLLADLRAARPELHVTIASGDPAATRAMHGVEAVERGDLPAVVEAIRSSDLVVLGGGGLLQDYWPVPLADALGPRSGGLPFYLAFPLLATLLGKPAVLCAVGAGPLSTDDGRALARAAVSVAAAATVRDRRSLDELAAAGVATAELARVEVTADPAWSLEPALAAELAPLLDELALGADERPLAVSLRPWTFAAESAGVEDAVAGALEAWLAERRQRALLLPFDGEDVAVLRSLTKRLGSRAVLVERVLAPRQLAALLARCDGALVMRYHAALFFAAGGGAATGGAPVALAYDPKVEALLADLGQPRLALPPARWRQADVLAALRDAAALPREPVAREVTALRERARRNAAAIVEALADGAPATGAATAGFGALGEMLTARLLSAFDTDRRVDGLDADLAAAKDLGEERARQLWAVQGELTERLAALHAAQNELAERGYALTAAAAALADSQRALVDSQRALAGEQATLAATRETLAAREVELGAARELTAQQREEIAALRGHLEDLARQRDELREHRALVLAERADLARRLDAFEATAGYRVLKRFWSVMRAAFPEGTRRRRLYRALRGAARRGLAEVPPSPSTTADVYAESPALAEAAGASPLAAAPAPDPLSDLLEFAERVREQRAPQVVAIFSATQLVESEGQRPMQLALALARRKVPVVFVYWRWHPTEWRPQDRLDDGILQIPIDVVAQRPEMLAGAFAGRDRIATFEFPWPGFLSTLAALNGSGWITVYDVLDDWEEFHRVGQAIWYDEPFERHLLTACDATFAINEVLAVRLVKLGAPAGVEVLRNGVRPGIETVRRPLPLPRGEITVGYFGYLASAWFDWELVAGAAARRPSWRFHLIGYGGSPEGVELPSNVELHGRKPQHELAALAANWDVAMVPFKPDPLAAGADPIKTYEYLAMGLPVVTTGVMPPPGADGLVVRADGVDGFLAAVAAAAAAPPEQRDARRAYAAANSWDSRVERLLAAVESGAQRVAEKRALFPAP